MAEMYLFETPKVNALNPLYQPLDEGAMTARAVIGPIPDKGVMTLDDLQLAASNDFGFDLTDGNFDTLTFSPGNYGVALPRIRINPGAGGVDVPIHGVCFYQTNNPNVPFYVLKLDSPISLSRIGDSAFLNVIFSIDITRVQVSVVEVGE